MSTSIGTLQQRARFKLWPVVVALLAVTAVAAYFTTKDRDTGREASTVSGTAANTPTELSGGLAGSILDTAANTPTELRGGIAQVAGGSVAELIGRRDVTPRVASDVANANTPTEIGGGLTVGGGTDARFHPLP